MSRCRKSVSLDGEFFFVKVPIEVFRKALSLACCDFDVHVLSRNALFEELQMKVVIGEYFIARVESEIAK